MSTGEHPVFEVRLRSKGVQRELDALQEADYERVLVKLRALANAPRPRGCEKLYDAIYRVRVGDFRIVYFIDEKNKRIEAGGIRPRTERTYRESRGYSVESSCRSLRAERGNRRVTLWERRALTSSLHSSPP